MTIQTDRIHKYIVTDDNTVQFYEFMGGRWVALGVPERWSDDLIRELLIDEVLYLSEV